MNKNLVKEENYYKLKLVGERGQITLDKRIRESCNIEAGSALLEIQVGKAIVLLQVDHIFEGLTNEIKQAFLNTDMTRDEIVQEIEETARISVIRRNYPNLGL